MSINEAYADELNLFFYLKKKIVLKGVLFCCCIFAPNKA